MLKLLETINSADKDKALEPEKLKRSFGIWWSRFEDDFKKILGANKQVTVVAERSEKEMIVEILDISRSLQRRVENAEDIAKRSAIAADYWLSRPGAGYSGYSVAPTAFQWLNTPEKKLSEADLAELTRRMREQEENKRAEIERALKERKGLGGPTVNE